MIEHDLHCIEPENIAPVGTVIWLHGLGADNRNFDSLIPELTQHGRLPLRFIFPNAPIRPITINQQLPMRAWYDIHSLSRLDKEDETGITESQAYVENLIEQEILNNMPAERIVLAGFSQGGAIALHTGLRTSKKLAGIMALSSYLPLFHQVSNAATMHSQDIPIFIAHGDQDMVLPIAASKITHSALNHYPNINYHEYSMGHEICYQEVKDITKWLANIFQ